MGRDPASFPRRQIRDGFEQRVRARLRAVWPEMNANRRTFYASGDLPDELHVDIRPGEGRKPGIGYDRPIALVVEGQEILVGAVPQRLTIPQRHRKAETDANIP